MATAKTVEVIPETFSYVFSPYREPIARVLQGQRVVIQCDDAFDAGSALGMTCRAEPWRAPSF